MQTVSIQMANKLSPNVKSAVEELLGRPIDDDEEITVIAVPPQQTPPFANRAAVAQKLEGFLNQRSEKTLQVCDDEIDAAIDEGADRVRHSRG
jgi:hypothetical protein